MTETQEKKDTVTTSQKKAIEHLAEAIGSIASRVVFLSETDARLFADRVAACLAHVRGDGEVAADAESRIAVATAED